ncbi:MAG TPA: ribonuclease R, partial [Bdellovibrionales bacterium]|nr:ribonuclease R [Bdellovibrionales bacterium]
MKKHLVEGIVKRHPDGFGFLVPDDTEVPDVYIPRHNMAGVMTNDRVQVKVERNQYDNRLSGEIVNIIKHATTKVLGVYHSGDSQFAYVPDENNKWGMDLLIPRAKTKNAREGQLVAVEVKSYPGSDKGFVGEVVEILGDAADPLTDIRRVVISHGIPTEFSRECLEEAKSFHEEVDPADYANRRDLRNVPFITIDGVTAKDFDDAIAVETTEEGFHLWVGIADVSYYVQPGTAIDKDAYERGNSTYFPNWVYPMLPEVLSNGLCSLRPKIPRLALVAEMKLDFQGDLLSAEFYEAVIQSRHRVTYGEAQEVIDGFTPEKLKDVEGMIKRAADLAKLLMNRRFAQGSLDLDVPQTEIQLDDAGNPVDISRSERLFAHRLIEELMLISNVAVGRYIENSGEAGIYRIHEEPAADNLAVLENFMRNFGARMKALSGGKLQKKITRALEQFEGKPEAQVINILTLRAMKQAQYDSHNVGHFGLGFETYTHFTSPIRRYSDLIVHRIVKALLTKSDKKSKGSNKGAYLYSEDELSGIGTHLSACEQRSVKSERQFAAIKRARFMSQHLGEEFDGVISSVTKFGVFVLLRAFDVDGLVKVEELGNDMFQFDEEN